MRLGEMRGGKTPGVRGQVCQQDGAGRFLSHVSKCWPQAHQVNPQGTSVRPSSPHGHGGKLRHRGVDRKVAELLSTGPDCLTAGKLGGHLGAAGGVPEAEAGTGASQAPGL